MLIHITFKLGNDNQKGLHLATLATLYIIGCTQNCYEIKTAWPTVVVCAEYNIIPTVNQIFCLRWANNQPKRKVSNVQAAGNIVGAVQFTAYEISYSYWVEYNLHTDISSVLEVEY